MNGWTTQLLGQVWVAALPKPPAIETLVAVATAHRHPLAIVVADRGLAADINTRDLPDVVAFGIDPADPESWQRILAHVEQRLGPIDAFAVAAAGVPDSVVRDVFTDMRARGTGQLFTVLAEVGEVEAKSPE